VLTNGQKLVVEYDTIVRPEKDRASVPVITMSISSRRGGTSPQLSIDAGSPSIGEKAALGRDIHSSQSFHDFAIEPNRDFRAIRVVTNVSAGKDGPRQCRRDHFTLHM
jgi:hypothetical protein